MLSPSRFRFLNEEHELTAPADWDNPAWLRLWLYSLHYFDDLDALDAPKRSAWHEALIARWMAENPPPAGPGWEPYCLSLRIVNWCRWAWSGGALSPSAVHSLAVQLRALEVQLEVHLLGNHLWANAKALVFGGLFFEGEEADRWLTQGLRYLSRELREQVLEDGGHFERSPMYHNIITADVLDLLGAARLAPNRLPDELVAELGRAVAPMVTWSRAMSHDDGEPSFFNDSAMGIAPSSPALVAQAEHLTLAGAHLLTEPLLHLTASGYVRARMGEALLLADVGEVGPRYLPGHAHADTLSFELSLSGRRFLVNSGTSVYEVSPQRLWERGTSAHNTVAVDEADSSEVWSSFRVARRALPRGITAAGDAGGVVVRGAHDGYMRLPGRVLHMREWRLTARELVIDDALSGRPRSASSYWRLHPDVAVEEIGPGTYRCRDREGLSVELAFDGGRTRMDSGTWAPEFGRVEPNVCLRHDFDGLSSVCRVRW
jgi:uncharacterized heparinase superfamily protein